MNIALKQLRVFVAVAQEKTITAAAERLFLTKPAVSMALAELEKQLSQPLFDRHNNRLTLNSEGKRLLPLADELLQRTQSIEQLFAQTGALSGSLAVGSSDTVGNQLTPFLLRDFRAQTAHTDQSLLIGNTASIVKKLGDFELDIGLVEGRVTEKHLVSQPWLKDEMVIIGHPEHPLLTRNNLSLSDFEHSEWVLREAGSGTRDYFLHHLAPGIDNWQLAFELNTTEAIINSVAAGLGLTCLSRRAVHHAVQEKRVAELPITLSKQRQYWLLYHKDKYNSPLLSAFIAFCQHWQPGSDPVIAATEGNDLADLT
ncbi:LysR family transcriptional regulator [Photobacterium sp. WH24]|uniref:LysR substrate-binding domain-containing protein n=1 Tax=Photobacterium sp. WH24 TaxID=2827237 RepID=UPI001C4461AB|nr:LysR substrate-binding domain-containing protein [Photobacterium sp. WH24]MBV7263761.1 LysR family transcriptional regulator [Photobacterium sp. WH24]